MPPLPRSTFYVYRNRRRALTGIEKDGWREGERNNRNPRVRLSRGEPYAHRENDRGVVTFGNDSAALEFASDDGVMLARLFPGLAPGDLWKTSIQQLPPHGFPYDPGRRNEYTGDVCAGVCRHGHFMITASDRRDVLRGPFNATCSAGRSAYRDQNSLFCPCSTGGGGVVCGDHYPVQRLFGASAYRKARRFANSGTTTGQDTPYPAAWSGLTRIRVRVLVRRYRARLDPARFTPPGRTSAFASALNQRSATPVPCAPCHGQGFFLPGGVTAS